MKAKTVADIRTLIERKRDEWLSRLPNSDDPTFKRHYQTRADAATELLSLFDAAPAQPVAQPANSDSVLNALNEARDLVLAVSTVGKYSAKYPKQVRADCAKAVEFVIEKYRVAQPEADPGDRYDADTFDEFLRTDPSAQYAMRQQWAKRMETAMTTDSLLDALKKVGCSAEYPECSITGIINGSQWVCANHAVSTRLWSEIISSSTTTPTTAAVEAVLDEAWRALRDECCKKPDEAKTIVFLSEKKFRDALGPVLSRYLPVQQPEVEMVKTEIGQPNIFTFSGAQYVSLAEYARMEKLCRSVCKDKIALEDMLENRDEADTAEVERLKGEVERLSGLIAAPRLSHQENTSMTKNYDGFRAGMLRAAEMARNEFKQAPDAAKGEDCVWMGGYESACDHLSIVIAQAAVIDSVRIAGAQPDWQYHIALLLPDEGIEDQALLKIYQVVEHELRTVRTDAIGEAIEAAKSVIAGWSADLDESWDERPDLSFEAADKITGANEIIATLEQLKEKGNK